MPLSIFKRLLICFCFALFTALPAQAEEQKNGTLPPALETALSTLLADAPQGKADPDAATVNTVLDFVATNKQAANKVRPEARPQGSGAYLKETLNVPLRKLVEYMLDPSIPGEAIYPSAVRRNAWMPGSPILKDNAALTDAAYPPAAPIVTRGVEYEETTPDTSSGCYYSYKLNRLFVLADYKGRTALISVSVMPGQSSVGLRGAIVGNDKDWTYVYTPEKGTNLAMLGWAETYLYGSASISVFMESAPGSGKVDVSIFKWAKAGWKGSNVVKVSHITAPETVHLRTASGDGIAPPALFRCHRRQVFRAQSDERHGAARAAFQLWHPSRQAERRPAGRKGFPYRARQRRVPRHAQAR